MDLCGPMRVSSLGGKKYVLVIVNDFSRFTWVKFLKSKDEASGQIMSFIKSTQVSLQLVVQCVRTDNGMEFKNHNLSSFYDPYGISQTFSAAELQNKMGYSKGTIVL